jgi:hypothetical protein
MPTDFAPGSAPTASARPLFAGTALLDAEKLDAQRGLAAATKSLLSGGRDRV